MGKMHSFPEVARTLCEIVPGARMETIGNVSKSTAGYPMIQKPCDLAASKAELDYRPQYQLTEALQDYLDWEQKKAVL